MSPWFEKGTKKSYPTSRFVIDQSKKNSTNALTLVSKSANIIVSAMERRMNLLGGEIIEDFKAKNADSRTGLDKFQQSVAQCKAKNMVELKNTFPSVDYVKPNFVFDISHNSYRLLAAVSFKIQTIIVMKVGTHAEYDKWDLKR